MVGLHGRGQQAELEPLGDLLVLMLILEAASALYLTAVVLVGAKVGRSVQAHGWLAIAATLVAAAAFVALALGALVASTRTVLFAQFRSASRIVNRSWQSSDDTVNGWNTADSCSALMLLHTKYALLPSPCGRISHVCGSSADSVASDVSQISTSVRSFAHCSSLRTSAAGPSTAS